MESAIRFPIPGDRLGRLYARRSSLLENVMHAPELGEWRRVVAGAVFTVPALYILKLNPHPVETIHLPGGRLPGSDVPDIPAVLR